MKTTRLLPWILFLSGALIYVIGLWRACPLLSGKGYFFGALMTGMFVTYAYQRAEISIRTTNASLPCVRWWRS